MSATTLPVRLEDDHRDALTIPINRWLGSVPEEFDHVKTVDQFDRAVRTLQTMSRVWHALDAGEITIDQPVRDLLDRWRRDYEGDIEGFEDSIEREHRIFPERANETERAYRDSIARTRARIAALDELLAA